MVTVPAPTCQLGYTRDDIEQILAEDVAAFDKWMYGQTFAICNGQRFDHYRREYKATGCGPHGVVIYPWDLDRFMNGNRDVL